jgi:hypothetical protein
MMTIMTTMILISHTGRKVKPKVLIKIFKESFVCTFCAGPGRQIHIEILNIELLRFVEYVLFCTQFSICS